MALEDHLLTEASNPHSAEIDRLSAVEIVRLMNAEDSRVVAAVRAETEAVAQAIEWTIVCDSSCPRSATSMNRLRTETRDPRAAPIRAAT